MRKRINLQVDKLIAKLPKKQKYQIDKSITDKHLSFQQLYQMARKVSGHTNSRMISSQPHAIYSSNSSQQTIQSLKNSRQTPQNTNRQNNHISQKLNRSLDTKSEQVQKNSGSMRSLSGGKYQHSQKSKPKNEKSTILAQQKCQTMNLKKAKAETNPPISELDLFQCQFKEQINKLNHSQHQHLRQTECFLNIEQSYQIMKGLHYLRKIEDQKHFVRLWQELQGEGYGGVPSNNLFEFLSYINHYNPTNYYQNHLQQKHLTSSKGKKIMINGNLKIVVTEKSKLEIYEQYLALRVNRILYGSGGTDYPSYQKKLHRTSNIKIIDEEPGDKEKQISNTANQNKRLSFKKKTTQDSFVQNTVKRIVRLKSAANPKLPKFQEIIKWEGSQKHKGKNQDTANEGLETRESKNNLTTSNQSESSINSNQINEQLQDRKPLLSIDVNLGEGLSQKLVVYEGESASQVSQRLVQKYKIDDSLRIKFQGMLSGHLRNLLWRIEQVSEDMFSDRQQ